jgi:catechol 2,3-dioxygenase-like lactoylglutathione lyase family enzyme
MPTHLNTVGLVVQDMAKSLAFYRAIGLDIPADEDAEPHVQYSGSNGYAIGFVSEAIVRQSDPKWSDNFGNRVNLQFKFDTPTEVDAIYTHLISAGYESYQAPWDAFWGQRFARIIDPDKNVVNLFAPLGD